MQIAINLPNDFVSFQSAADIEKDMRLSYSLWLFKNTRVTLAKAAELAGLDIYDFMSACKQNEGAGIDISKEELLEELAGMGPGWFWGLLINDKRGRKVAKINQISTIGLLGVLLVTKEKRLIVEVAPLLQQIEQSDIYLSPDLIADGGWSCFVHNKKPGAGLITLFNVMPKTRPDPSLNIPRRALATETGWDSLCGMDAETQGERHEKKFFAVFRLLISVNVNIL
jgi:predicted HTH domain antitoxin